MSTKEKMLKARDLIRQKKYDQARAILNTVNHPKAEEWLAKIDKIAPVKAKRGRGLLTLVAAVVILALVGAAVFIAPQLMDGNTVSAAGLDSSAQQDRTYPLAEYMPSASTLYFSIRTDDGYIEALDGVLASLDIAGLAEATGAPIQGVPTDVRSLLDLATLSAGLGGNFEATIRPWLGDNIAVGLIVDASGADAQGVVAIDINSKDAAMSFINNSPMGGALTQSEVNGFTVLEGVPGFVGAMNDNVFLLSSDRAFLPVDAPLPSTLAGNAAFTDAMNSLPAEAYNIYSYVDLGFIMQSAALVDPESAAALQAFGLDQIGASAIGATVLDGSTLTIDIAQAGGGLITQMQSMGLTVYNAGPVNPDFLANIPADTNMILHGKSLRNFYDSLSGIGTAAEGFDPESTAQIEEGLAQIELAVQQATGLDLEADILSWLTGDYVFFVSGTAPEPGVPYLGTAGALSDGMINIGVEVGIVVESVDPAKARTFVDSLANIIMEQPMDPGMSVTRQEIAGANALVLTINDESLAAPIDIIMGANDNVFVIGTRDGATAALSGSGGLNSAAVNQAASQYYLPNSISNGYISRDGVIMLGDFTFVLSTAIDNVFSEIVMGLEGGTMEEDPNADAMMQQQVTQTQQMVRAVASRINNMTISSALVDGETALSRITITLGN